MRHIARAILFTALITTSNSAWASERCPSNLIPMYGRDAKSKANLSNEEQQKLISNAKAAINLGWRYFRRDGDPMTAMKRFNQAWLLNPENGEAYSGMAVMVEVLSTSDKFSNCPYSPQLSERLFKIALSKPQTPLTAQIDYGRFLWTQDRFDESLSLLHDTLKKDPKVPDARTHISFIHYRQGDFAKACTWAKQAKDNGDELEKGYLKEMCDRAK